MTFLLRMTSPMRRGNIESDAFSCSLRVSRNTAGAAADNCGEKWDSAYMREVLKRHPRIVVPTGLSLTSIPTQTVPAAQLE
jgi:hypothetical protein